MGLSLQVLVPTVALDPQLTVHNAYATAHVPVTGVQLQGLLVVSQRKGEVVQPIETI